MSIYKFIEKLMQPGDSGCWQEEAQCYADKRFTGEKPDEVTCKILARICSKCPVIVECYASANRTGATGVFIAGEWRE